MRTNRLRPIRAIKNYLPHAEGSCLFCMGSTRVLCVATVEDKVPPHAEEKGTGWVTAEYSMLPRAGTTRTPRGRASQGGRAQEISRLIGRSLRGAVDLAKMPGKGIVIDCDVLQADGGTRTASINGGMIALAMALRGAHRKGGIASWPLRRWVSAVSVGVVDGKPILDLNYELDQRADCDMNFVLTDAGRFIEVQGTAESAPFSESEFQAMVRLARKGIREILKVQKKTVGALPR